MGYQESRMFPNTSFNECWGGMFRLKVCGCCIACSEGESAGVIAGLVEIK